MTILNPRPAPRGAGVAPLPLPRRDPITQLPILILFPHSRCNCRCLMCDIWRGEGKQELAPTDIARWVAEWRALGVERVVLSGGEALMHSRLWELCDLLRASNIGISILSTGLLLRRHAAELVQRCDDIVVSLDGPKAVHDHIRNVPRAYDRLADGVVAIRETGRDIQISGRCTVQRANYESLRATVDAATELGLGRISFLAADVSSAAFNRPDGWTDDHVQDVALQPDDLPRLAEEIDSLERERSAQFQSGFIAESPDKLRRRLSQYFAALLGHGEFAPNDCNAPWVSSVIEADGTVRPCFFQPALGNIHTAGSGGLAGILNSPEAVAWRQRLDTHRDAICRRCVCTLSLSADHVP